MGMTPEETEFARAEFARIWLDNEELRRLCHTQAKGFWPIDREAAPLVCAKIIDALRDGTPLSILRVGNGEGNAVSMTKAPPLHPLQVSTFYQEFVSQNGIAIPQDVAIHFCSEVRAALSAADILGFRCFRKDEHAVIQNCIDRGDAYAALGFLYALEFLQQGISAGVWRQAIVTGAWIHLDLVPHLGRLIEGPNAIIVITGRVELKSEIQRRLGERLEELITVPVQGFQPSCLADSHFCSTFQSVRNRLRGDLRGKLVLVGAGLFGKVYCHEAKLSGAVAVDLGSAFDLLAGLKIRPVHDAYDTAAMRWI
jgi:hypothetical protein